MRRVVKPGPEQQRLFSVPIKKPKVITDTNNKLILFYRNFLTKNILHYIQMTDNQLKAMRANPKPDYLMPMWFSIKGKLEQGRIIPSKKQIDVPARFVRTRTIIPAEKKYAKRILFNTECLKILLEINESVKNHNIWEIGQKERLLLERSRMNNPQWAIYSKIMAEKECAGIDYEFSMP